MPMLWCFENDKLKGIFMFLKMLVGVGSHHERFVNYMNNKFNIDWSMMSNENKYECKVIEIMTSDKRVEFVFRCN